MVRVSRASVVGVLGAAVAAAVMMTAGWAPGAAWAQGQVAARKFELDSVHSMVIFRISHMDVAAVYGRFNEPTGTFNLDMANPSSSFIEITIDANKVDTANERRDNHLRSPDFFNAKQFPAITFKSSSIEKAGEKRLKVRGALTLLGVTKTIEANLEFLGEGKTMQGYKSGFEAEFTIKRSDFGMMKFIEEKALGDEVKLVVTAEGKLAGQ